MNKQRITRLTKREKAASKSGGVMNPQIPEECIWRRLRDEPRREFDANEIIKALARRVALIRMMGSVPRLEPAEVARQAAATIEVLDELSARLENQHPELDCLVNDHLFRARGEFLPDLVQRIEADLHRLRATLKDAQKAVLTATSKTGPKPTAWQIGRDAVAETLREHSAPTMPKREAVALAAELLDLCGLPKPRQ